MADLLRQFGSVPLALAAYNAGPGAVAACDCVPPYPGDPGLRRPDPRACSTAPARSPCRARARGAAGGLSSSIGCRAMAAVQVDGIEEAEGADRQDDRARRVASRSPRRTSTRSPSSRGDDQWIHVDVERAKTESPFGTTVAHGNLTLSLIDGFRLELIESTGFKLGVNYGWNKVRFPAPVPAGSRVRATAEVVSVDEVGGGWWQVVTRFTVEVEGNEKPCCVAESVGRILV